jgi:hypothetical protein
MADIYHILAYAAANGALVVICSVLAGLSFFAYYRNPGQRSYVLAGLGFSSIGLAGLGESMYTLVVGTDYLLSSTEFLLLQAGEDVGSALGLGLLFLAILRHRPEPSETERNAASSDESKYLDSEMPFDD